MITFYLLYKGNTEYLYILRTELKYARGLS